MIPIVSSGFECYTQKIISFMDENKFSVIISKIVKASKNMCSECLLLAKVNFRSNEFPPSIFRYELYWGITAFKG